MKFIEHIMRKDGLANNILIRHIEDKMDRRRNLVTYLISLCEWMDERRVGALAKRQMLLRSTRDGRWRRDIMAYALKRHVIHT